MAIFKCLLILHIVLLAACDNEVPVDQVIMDENPVLLLGRQGDLQCRFRGVPIAVFWMKGDTFETAEDLITFHRGATTVPNAINKGLYEIRDDYYLIIHNVTMETAGRYFCRVSDFRGYIIRSHTDVTVKVPPTDSYPAVDQCDSNQDCSIDLNDRNTTQLTCRTDGASMGLVSLVWTSPPGCTIYHEPIARSPSPSGLTENVSATITFQPCPGEFMCRATLAATRVGVSTTTVRVTAPLNMISTTALTTTQEAGILPPTSSNRNTITIAVIVPMLVISLITAAVVWFCYIHRQKEAEYTGPISYVELWMLVKSGNETFDQKFSKMITGLSPPKNGSGNTVLNTDETFAFQCNSTELRDYHMLCAWKRRTQASGADQGHELSKALRGADLEEKVDLLREYREDRSDTLSDDDLKHICWAVHGREDTFKKALKYLALPSKKPESDVDDNLADENQNNVLIKKDFKLLNEWRNTYKQNAASVSDDTAGDPNMNNVRSNNATDEVNTRPKRRSPKMEMCLALEKANFHDIAESFFLISTENKRLSAKDLDEFALEISGRHCSQLGNAARLSSEEIQKRNRENQDYLFDTIGMLRDWIATQKCSNYDIRCKLRDAGEKSGRSDLNGVFVKPGVNARNQETTPTMPTTTGIVETSAGEVEKGVFVKPGINARNQETTTTMPTATVIVETSAGEVEKGIFFKPGVNARNQETTPTMPTTTGIEETSAGEVEKGVFVKPKVSAIQETTPNVSTCNAIDETFAGEVEKAYDVTDEEIQRIERLGGEKVMEKLRQQSLIEEVNGRYVSVKEAKSVNIIDRYKGHEIENTPRKCIHTNLSTGNYAFLLPALGERAICSVELVDVGRRIAMDDLQRFTEELLGDSKTINAYMRDIITGSLDKGTYAILINHAQKQASNAYQPRIFLAKFLKGQGYHDVAKIILFGCHFVGPADILEVARVVKEKHVDFKELLDHLGVENLSLPSAFDVEDEGSLNSVLGTWRHMLPNPGYNLRTALADAVFLVLKDRQLALDILSGKHRKKTVVELQQHLAEKLSPDEIKTLCDDLGLQSAGVTGLRNVLKKLNNVLGSSSETKQISDRILEKGFYDLAFEVLEGLKSEKDSLSPKQLASSVAGTKTTSVQGRGGLEQNQKETRDGPHTNPSSASGPVISSGQTPEGNVLKQGSASSSAKNDTTSGPGLKSEKDHVAAKQRASSSADAKPTSGQGPNPEGNVLKQEIDQQAEALETTQLLAETELVEPIPTEVRETEITKMI